jgi:hypothetical protein
LGAGEDPGLDELLHVMGQRGLGDPERLGQMTRTHLRAIVGGDVFHDPHPRRIAQRLEQVRPALRFVSVQQGFGGGGGAGLGHGTTVRFTLTSFNESS